MQNKTVEICRELRVGYKDPGLGWKGKQRWVTCDDSLKVMYKVYSSKNEILIWCFLHGRIENTEYNQQLQQMGELLEILMTSMKSFQVEF